MLIKPIFQVLHPFLGEGKETTFRWQKQEITSWHWKMMKFQWCEDKKVPLHKFCVSWTTSFGKKKIYPNWSISWGLVDSVTDLPVFWIHLKGGDVGLKLLMSTKNCWIFVAAVLLEFPRLQKKKTSCVKKEEPTVVFFYLGIGTLQVNFLKWMIFKMSFNSTWRSWNFS